MRRARRIGRYQLTERIAFGGMAEIYRGFTFDLDGFRHLVAVKKLLPSYLEDREFVDMLTDEFKLVSYLRHPGIAKVYELTELDGSLIIAMEYVDGKDLRATIEQCQLRGKPLTLDDYSYIMARALDGLHQAHIARDSRGDLLNIVHRDFSPSNVVVAYDGMVKIIDFGIAKAASSRIQTEAGIIKGKIKYMSPEQALGRRLDWRSDIFSVGSVLYELTTGVSPFSAPTERDLIFTVREATPRPCQEINPEIPDQLAQIIQKAMARSRSARYQSSVDFRDDLIRFLESHNPNYRRRHLAQRMRFAWRDEIETELRSLEEYALEEVDPESLDYGTNLLADVMGDDAEFSQFVPSPGTLSGGEETTLGDDGDETEDGPKTTAPMRQR